MEPPRGYRLLLPHGTVPATNFRGEPRVVTDYVMATRFRGTLRVAERASLLGPVISLQAALVMPGLQARIVFRDRPRPDDAQGQETSVLIPLVLPGERMERPLQTLRGAPGRPALTLSLFDRARRPLGPLQEMRADEDGTHRIEMPVVLEVGVVVWLSACAGSASSGPRLRVNGKLVFTRGITAQIGLGPGSDRQTPERVVSELPLVHPGSMFFFYERTVESGLPGDPWVSLRFVDEKGAPIGDEQPVGLISAA